MIRLFNHYLPLRILVLTLITGIWLWLAPKLRSGAASEAGTP